jgi:hypothetical protein
MWITVKDNEKLSVNNEDGLAFVIEAVGTPSSGDDTNVVFAKGNVPDVTCRMRTQDIASVAVMPPKNGTVLLR